MRRLSIAALMAVPLFLIASAGKAPANPPAYNGFGCGDFCLGLFKGIHQHGPLYNYGPYYGYYPFKPYGPWDAYLRYDPFFYGDPYANWGSSGYGHSHNLHHFSHIGFHKHGCASCGFWHASWVHGGWYRGHNWLQGGTFGASHKSCSSCGGVAVATPAQPTGNVLTRYSGFGAPEQSAIYYSATPTLNPVFDLVPTAAQMK